MTSADAITPRQILRVLLPYATRRWKQLAGLALTTLTAAGVGILKPWPMQFIVDYALLGQPLPPALCRWLQWAPAMNGAIGKLWYGVLAIGLLFVLGWACQLVCSLAQIAFGQRMAFDLASDLFSHLQRLSLRYHARRSTGDMIRRVTSDSECISAIAKDALLPLVSAGITLVVMVVIMWRIDSALTLMAIAVMPMMLLVLKHFARPMMDRAYEQQQAEGRIYSHVERTFSAIPVVQAFRAETRHDRELRQNTNAALAAALVTTDAQLRFKIVLGLCTAAGTAGIILVGARHVMAGSMSVGTLLVFLAYLAALYRPIEAIFYSTFSVHGAFGSARRVVEVLLASRDVADLPGAVEVPRVDGNLSIENVSFGYTPQRNVIDDVSLQIEPGQTVAIVGATGAGKTTLASLIPRFIDPDTGVVRIDGRDIRQMTLASVRANVSIVLQESFLFPTTIAQNIAYGRPTASRDEILAAARAANAHAFIEALPDGYETRVGERGATLSAGQRQRIAIARALLRDSPVLILDEPTSSLDAATESAVLNALRTLMHGRTTLVIAHRLSTIRNADRIVVLDSGRIVEQGTHDELIAAAGQYAALFAARVRHLDRQPKRDTP